MVSPPLPHAARLPRNFLVALGAAVAATAGFAAWLGWQVGGKTLVLYVSDAGQVLTPLIASVACFRAGLRHEKRLRTFWWLLGAACGSWMLGEMIWTGYDLTSAGGPPIPSWADVASSCSSRWRLGHSSVTRECAAAARERRAPCSTALRSPWPCSS